MFMVNLGFSVSARLAWAIRDSVSKEGRNKKKVFKMKYIQV